jgi:hypothetical protein
MYDLDTTIEAAARDAHASAATAMFDAQEALTIAKAEAKAAHISLHAAHSGDGDPHAAHDIALAADKKVTVLSNVHAARVVHYDAATANVSKAIAAMYQPVYNEGATMRLQAAKAANNALDALKAAEKLFADGTAAMRAAIQRGTPDVLVAAISGWDAGYPMVELPNVHAQHGKADPLSAELHVWSYARQAEGFINPLSADNA